MDIPENVREAKRANEEALLKKSNVIGVGVGEKWSNGENTGKPSVIVLVQDKMPLTALSTEDRVPSSYGDVPVDVIRVGHIKAQIGEHEGQFRPLKAGVSIGHKDITAGTLGIFVTRDGRPLILSNNHVLANCNDAKPGDAILQPGPYDGGGFFDRVGTLYDYLPIRYGGDPNYVDAALATIDTDPAPEPPLDEAPSEEPAPKTKGVCGVTKAAISAFNAISAKFKRPYRLQAVHETKPTVKMRGVNFTNEILNLPFKPSGHMSYVEVGDEVHKSGRTTGYTKGTVIATEVTVDVDYSDSKTSRWARFTQQIMAGAMSEGGDSGSAVFDNGGNLVGLLFAGSDEVTIINPIQTVFLQLRIDAIHKPIK